MFGLCECVYASGLQIEIDAFFINSQVCFISLGVAKTPTSGVLCACRQYAYMMGIPNDIYSFSNSM